MVGLLATSKRTYASNHLPGLLLAMPLSLRQANAIPCFCRRPSNTHRQVLLSLLWGDYSFPLGPGTHKFLFTPSKSLCFPQYCGSSIIKFHCPAKLPYDPAIPLLGTYPDKTIIQKDTCTTFFISALFTITRSWKKPRYPYPLTDEYKEVVIYIWIHMCVYIHIYTYVYTHNRILLSHIKEHI